MKRNGIQQLETSDEFCIPETLRDTPEKRMLCAILERAIKDAIEPHVEKERFSDRDEFWEKMMAAYKLSGLSVHEFARRNGIGPANLNAHLNEAKANDSGYFYIFEDERDASQLWSFEWVLSHLFPDVAGAKSHIRKLIMEKILTQKHFVC